MKISSSITKTSMFISMLFLTSVFYAQLSGVKTIPIDYATIGAALNDINAQGVNGPLTINIPAGYTETVTAPGGYSLTATGTATSPIIFQKSGAGANPILYAMFGVATHTSTQQDGILMLIGSDYVTIDGIDFVDPFIFTAVQSATANIRTAEFALALFKASAFNGCQYNTIINCSFRLNREAANRAGIFTMTSGGMGIIITNALYNNCITTLTANISLTPTTVVNPEGANSFNKIYSNTFNNCYTPISIVGLIDNAPYLAADRGNDIGGNSIATGNKINTFAGVLYTAAPATAAGIIAAGQYNLNVSFNEVYNNKNNTGVFHGGTIRAISVGSAIGANVTINSNTVSLSSTLTAANGGIFIENISPGTIPTLTPSLITNTINIRNNIITGSVFSNTTATGILTFIQNTGQAAYLNLTNNTVNNNTFRHTTSIILGIHNNAIIYTKNNFNNNYFSITQTNTATVMGGTHNYMYNQLGIISSSVNFMNNVIENVQLSNPTFTNIVAMSGTENYFYNGASSKVLNFSNNAVRNMTLNSSGSMYLFYNTGNTDSLLTVANNTFTNINKLSNAGFIYGYYCTVSSSEKSQQYIYNNIFTSIVRTHTATGTGGFYAIYNTDGSAANYPRKYIYDNVINNINFTNATGTNWPLYLNYLGNGNTPIGSKIYNNSVTNYSTSGSCYGIYLGTVNSLSVGVEIYNNKFDNMFQFHTSNVLSAMYLTGNSTLGFPSLKVYNNKITNLTHFGASSVLRPIHVLSINQLDFYNNYIGNIYAPNANTPLGIEAIYINPTINDRINIHNNTIRLDAVSTTTVAGAQFGSAVISVANNNAKIELKNNILLNLSTPIVPSNTTHVFSVVYKRVDANHTNHLKTSNNNFMSAGTPGPNNLIFWDSQTSTTVPLAATVYSNVAAYQATVTPADIVTHTLTPAFMSMVSSNPNYLHIDASVSTPLESGGAASTLAITDYDNDIRFGETGYAGNGTSKDVGADEFNGTSPAVKVVTVVITPTGNQCTAVGRTITANIIPSGSSLTTVYLDYSINGVSQPTLPLTGGDLNAASNWTIAIPAMTVENDKVAWKVVTKDMVYAKVFEGATYKDNPLLGFVLTATVAPNPVCATFPLTFQAIPGHSILPANTIAHPGVSFATSDEDIAQVSLSPGLLNNLSIFNSLTSQIGTAIGVSGSYSDFTAFGPFTYTAGQTYTLSLTSYQQGTGQYNNLFAAFIDYNRDGVFSSNTEKVYASTVAVLGAHTETFVITIPATACNGTMRMRVMNKETTTPISTAIEGIGYGEVEDYLLNITSNNTCGGLPPVISYYNWNGTSNSFTSEVLNPTTTLLTNNSYTAVAVDFNGCTISTPAPLEVAVIPLPDTPFTSDASQCGTRFSNASVMSPIGVYNWYASNTATAPVLQTGSSSVYTIVPLANTTTLYVVANDRGCLSSARAAVVTTVTPLLDPIESSIITTSLQCNATPNLTLATTQGTLAPYTYTWIAIGSNAANAGLPNDINTATINVNPTVPGTYSYVSKSFQELSGCALSSTLTIRKDSYFYGIPTISTPTLCSGVDNQFTMNFYDQFFIPRYTLLPTITNASVPDEDEDMGYISFGPLTNQTTQHSLVGTIGTATGSAGRYSNFSMYGPFTYTAGQTYTLEIGSITSGGPWTNRCAVFIDLNRNDVFTDPGEMIFVEQTVTGLTQTGAHTTTGSVTIPSTAFNGISRMRVLVGETSSISGYQNSYTWGEYEDYQINIVSNNVGGGPAQNMAQFGWNVNNAVITGSAMVNTYSTSVTSISNMSVVGTATTMLGCPITSSLSTFTVHPLPPAPLVFHSDQCGFFQHTATVSNAIATTTNDIFIWYSLNTPTAVAIQSSSSKTIAAIINTTTIYYVSYFNGTCESGSRSTLTANVVLPDPITASISSSTVCPRADIITLSAASTGTNMGPSYVYTWLGGLNSGMANTITATTTTVIPLQPGTYVYTLTAQSGSCVAMTSTVLTSVNAYVDPLNIVASQNPVCFGQSNSLFAIYQNTAVSNPIYTPNSVTFPTSDEDIGNVTFGSLNNTSAINSLVGSIGTATGTAGGYSDFSMFGSYVYYYNQQYQLDMTSLTTGTSYDNNFSAFIDWNQDGDFNDLDERVMFSGLVQVSGAHLESTVVVVPSHAKSGKTRLRVMNKEGGNITSATTSVFWGEVEDYSIIIMDQLNTVWYENSLITSNTTSSFSIASVTSTNTYSVELTNSFGCKIPANVVTVTPIALPVINLVASNPAICAGSTNTITATGNSSTLVWAHNNATTNTIVVNPLITTEYTVRGMLNGCFENKSIILAVIPVPTMTVTPAIVTAICPNTSNTLVASASQPLTYTWNPSGSTSNSVSGTFSTTVVYSVTGTNGQCSTSSVITVVVKNERITTNLTHSMLCSVNPQSPTVTTSGYAAGTLTWTPLASLSSSAALTPSATTVYTLDAVSTTGCALTRTFEISLVQSPVVSMVANSPMWYCIGGSTSLTAATDATESIIWIPNQSITTNTLLNVVVNPIASMNYTFIATRNGCQTTSVVAIDVRSLPTATIIASTITPCTGESVKLDLDTDLANTAIWNTGATTRSITVTPTTTPNQVTPESYTVTVSDGNCTVSKSITLTVNPCIGIEEIHKAVISIYPNPVVDKLVITLTSTQMQGSKFNIYDALGKLVSTQELKLQTTVIDMSNLASGVYMYQVEHKQSKFAQGKLIKQ